MELLWSFFSFLFFSPQIHFFLALCARLCLFRLFLLPLLPPPFSPLSGSLGSVSRLPGTRSSLVNSLIAFQRVKKKPKKGSAFWPSQILKVSREDFAHDQQWRPSGSPAPSSGAPEPPPRAAAAACRGPRRAGPRSRRSPSRRLLRLRPRPHRLRPARRRLCQLRRPPSATTPSPFGGEEQVRVLCSQPRREGRRKEGLEAALTRAVTKGPEAHLLGGKRESTQRALAFPRAAVGERRTCFFRTLPFFRLRSSFAKWTNSSPTPPKQNKQKQQRPLPSHPRRRRPSPSPPAAALRPLPPRGRDRGRALLLRQSQRLRPRPPLRPPPPPPPRGASTPAFAAWRPRTTPTCTGSTRWRRGSRRGTREAPRARTAAAATAAGTRNDFRIQKNSSSSFSHSPPLSQAAHTREQRKQLNEDFPKTACFPRSRKKNLSPTPPCPAAAFLFALSPAFEKK